MNEISTVLFPNGNKSMESQMKNGLRNGKTKIWRFDGSLAEEIEYTDGLIDGKVIKYDLNGSIEVEYSLKMGAGVTAWRQGNSICYTDVIANSKPHGLQKFHESNGRITIFYYVNGKKVSKKRYIELALTDSSLNFSE